MAPAAETGIVDAHIHLYPAEVAADPAAWGRARGEPGWTRCVAPSGGSSIQGWADPDALIADMDEAGVGACVMQGWYWERQETCDLQNGWYAQWTRRHPGRLMGFAAVQPAAGAKAIEALERALDSGLCGVGEILPQAQGFELEGPLWRRVVETAIRRGVPITLHATDPRAPAAAGPKTPLDAYVRMGREYPEARFILAHWGGGLALREPPPGGELPANVYFDTAASPLLYDPGVFRRAVDRVGAGRILYGSDYPLILYPRQPGRRGFKRFLDEIARSGLSDGERAAILGSNIRRLLAPGMGRGADSGAR
ncbi:MAG: amidohydrolase family protein [Opitutaceae bacterium]|jgi:predicted TIM-barrel fold metal-dependent hydrolase